MHNDLLHYISNEIREDLTKLSVFFWCLSAECFAFFSMNEKWPPLITVENEATEVAPSSCKYKKHNLPRTFVIRWEQSWTRCGAGCGSNNF